jgi:hypothetical protein
MGQLVLDLFGPRSPAVTSKASTASPLAYQGDRQGVPSTGPRKLSAMEPWGNRGGEECDDLKNLTMVFSSRLKRSWRLESPRGPRSVLHLPASLRNAPPEIWRSLGAWVRASRKPSPGSKSASRQSANAVFAWLGEPVDRLPVGGSKGRFHDLAPIFERLNRVHFDGRLSAIVRWSPKPGGLSTHRTLRLVDGTRHVITIGQLYDHKDVPLVAVEGVLFHEMLHIEHPPRGDGARRHVHHAQFRQAERAFVGYQAWKDWERQEAPSLLRGLRRAASRARNRRS